VTKSQVLIIEGNAKFQLEVSENKDVIFFPSKVKNSCPRRTSTMRLEQFPGKNSRELTPACSSGTLSAFCQDSNIFSICCSSGEFYFTC
jgi:hypothetical protein